MAAVGASFNHVSRESTDINRLANFYQDIFGFERIESPKLDFKVIWLRQSPSFCLHLIERDPNTKLPEGPWSANDAVADPKTLPRGHHLCFSVSNFDSFVAAIKVRRNYMSIMPSFGTHYMRTPALYNQPPGYIHQPAKGIETHEKAQPNGKTKQVFFFDPDGNGLEVCSYE